MVPGKKKATVPGQSTGDVMREVKVRSDQVILVFHRRSSFMGGDAVGNVEEETGTRILMIDSGEVQIVGSLEAVNMAEDKMVAIFGKSEKKLKRLAKSKQTQTTNWTDQKSNSTKSRPMAQEYMARELYLADTSPARYYLTAKKQSSSEIKRGGMPALGMLKDKTGTSKVVGENCQAMVSGLLEAKEEAKDEKVTMSGKYECGPKTVGQSKAQKGNKSKRNQMMCSLYAALVLVFCDGYVIAGTAQGYFW